MTRRGPERPAAGWPERRSDAALLLAFVSLGAVSSTIPAAIPGLAQRLGEAAADLLPSVSLLFLGLFAGVLLTAVPRRGSARTLLPVGAGLQSAGLVVVAFAGSVPTVFVGATVTGVGFGLVEASATALSRARSAEGTPARLTALNAASAVAAAGAPLVVAFAPAGALGVAVGVVAVVPAAAAALAVGARSAWAGASGSTASGSAVSGARSSAVRSAPAGRVWLIGAALLLFVGAETVLAGWSSTLPQALFAVSAGGAAVGTTVFWTLMAAGRFACTAILARGVRPRVYLTVAMFAGALVAALSALAGHGLGAALLICAVVLCIAPGYALLLGAALAATPPERAVRTASALVALGAAGGSAVSFVVAVTVGSAPAAVLLVVSVLLVGCALVCLAALRPDAGARPPSEATRERAFTPPPAPPAPPHP
ncbi:sugar MFS transporter [Leifsonia sp. LS-T14]|uniref:MFS transporter n=1 Tax=unclassified Leifsonia TaxID=2663824 RepID=UPI0035A5D76F